ncbi:MAG TPA: MMPL family transporter [Kofleriaceae bacterium]|nr:MMPL family transporter [Kofleriaceae bacterium]
MKLGGAFASRYAAWIERRRWAIVVGSILFAGLAGWGASKLEVFSDFSYLLPQDVRAVTDLRAISARARVLGTAMVAVESKDPVARRRAAVMLRQRVSKLPLVSSITFDDRAKRDYAWNNRWLFADLADLQKAKTAIEDKIKQAKLEANPLFINLDDDDAADKKPAQAKQPAAPDATDELRDKLRKAEAERDKDGELTSKDGELQMMIVRTAFSSGDVDKDKELIAGIDAIMADVRQAVPGTDMGVAGDIVVSIAEHDSILNGMLLSVGITVGLVMIALIWYFRSALAVGAISWSLMVGVVATFAFTKLAIGHLNLATAFLSSIVIGNGINVGILVTARYLEELRAGRDGAEALSEALAHTIAGTLAAALTAAVAYASLMITVFRGFRHFGVIGGVGILLCWLSAYLVLPAALSIARHARMRPRGVPALGRWLARLLPRHLGWTAGFALGLIAVAAGITAHYLLGDPFESNFKNLRSRSAGITEERRWMHAIDKVFGEGIDAGFVIALPRREDVAPLRKRLDAVDAGADPQKKLFASLNTLDDALPAQQPEKLVVLAQIRELLSSKDIDALDDADRTEILKLRPPDGLRALGDNDIPEAIAWPFIESDGSRGKLILATAGPGYEVWDAHDTVRFAGKVRALDLPPDVHLGGASFVFADVLESVLTDGPRATLASLLGAILVVLLVVGRNRHGMITIACGLGGTILMLGVAALLGLKINFLDFAALPITIGIGIEYSVNIATRERQEGPGRGRQALATTGGAVALCSYTTIIGYGSLLSSANLGIRSFGLAAMIGELACLAVAIVLAPALLWVTAPKATRRDEPIA